MMFFTSKDRKYLFYTIYYSKIIATGEMSAGMWETTHLPKLF
jgi:hypothetical protein